MIPNGIRRVFNSLCKNEASSILEFICAFRMDNRITISRQERKTSNNSILPEVRVVNKDEVENKGSNQNKECCFKSAGTKQEKTLKYYCLFLMAVVITLIVVLCLIATKAVSPTPIHGVNQESKVCNTQACKDIGRMIQESMDLSADPCDDFFQYACGGWMEKNQIPEDKTRYSTFDILRDQLANDLSDLLEGNATDDKNVPKAVKDAAIFFRGCVNEEARQEQGLEPLKLLIKKFKGWPMIDSDWNEIGYQWHVEVVRMLRTLGVGNIISAAVSADSKNTSRHIVYVGEAQFGLGRNQLINLNASVRNEEIVSAYKEYIKSSAKLLNPNYDEFQLSEDANSIVEFESSLAKLTRTPEEKRNASSSYNKMTVREMQLITENEIFDWKDFLNILFQGIETFTDDSEVVLADVDYVKNALKLTYDTDVRTVANYIGFQIAFSFGSQTTLEFRQSKFNFSKVKTGIEKMPLLRLDCLNLAVGVFDYSIGRLYVDRYFAEEAKSDVEDMVEEIRSAYYATLKHSEWLDDATKSKALDKLDAITSMMGYPQWIKKNQDLDEYYKEVGILKEDEYFSSLLTVFTAIIEKHMQKINQPTNKTSEWIISPAVVNAFYNPSANSITFPAGILNLPFYKYSRPMSLNFGGIGSVIGHEISHGFDDEGSQYDKDGNIANWWSENIRQKFERKAQCFKDQYSSYLEPTTNMYLNGNNSIGENIADNAGLRSSYIAYKLKLMLSEKEIQNMKLPGISATPDELFFIAYASVWCGSQRKEQMEMTIQYDVHSPTKYRVIVPLSNFKAFAETFNCPTGSPMNPEAKCILW